MDVINNVLSLITILLVALAFYGVWFRNWAKKHYEIWMPSFLDRPVTLLIFIVFFKALITFLLVVLVGAYVLDRLG